MIPSSSVLPTSSFTFPRRKLEHGIGVDWILNPQGYVTLQCPFVQLTYQRPEAHLFIMTSRFDIEVPSYSATVLTA